MGGIPALPRLILHLQGSSDRERLSAHSEALALQERLGISYKDAAHRLYMAELEKIKSDEKMYKAFKNLDASTENALQKALQIIKKIEESPATGSGDTEQGVTEGL